LAIKLTITIEDHFGIIQKLLVEGALAQTLPELYLSTTNHQSGPTHSHGGRTISDHLYHSPLTDCKGAPLRFTSRDRLVR